MGTPRAIWSGTLSFGLVNVPVSILTATEDCSIHFNQFQRGTQDRIRNKRVNERTGEEVAWEDIAKGYDAGDGEPVILTDDEIKDIAPEKTHTIGVKAFVEWDAIDPRYFDKTYYVLPPSKGTTKGAEHAYALLRDAMAKNNRVALASFVLRDREYPVAIRPSEGALVLHTLHYHDEIRTPTRVPTVEWTEAEMKAAQKLIGSLETKWDPAAQHDSFRDRLADLIEQKHSGKSAVKAQSTKPQAAEVGDLLSALEASLKEAKVPAKKSPRRAPAKARPAA